MGKTILEIKKDNFYINGNKTYSDSSNVNARGLLMNARFIQGVFDAQTHKEDFNRFGEIFDAEKNTDELIRALPEWYRYGLRAITVGLQGGGPCFTMDKIGDFKNNPYSENGESINSEYLRRLDKVIRAADEIGMVVIVSFFYICQADIFKDNSSVIEAVKNSMRFLVEQKYTNIMVDIANEHDFFERQNANEMIGKEENMVQLIKIAQEECNNMIPIGCSCLGGVLREKVALQSDIVLIHGNGCNRTGYYKLIKRAKELCPNKPIVCNEDSQVIENMIVSIDNHVSWGYYNNMTKQEPPVVWNVTRGEDQFFANRLAEKLGYDCDEIDEEDKIYLQGFEKNMTVDSRRWIRVASLYPELIDRVEYYVDGELKYTAYDKGFLMNFIWTWRQGPLMDDEWNTFTAKIYKIDGKVKVINKIKKELK